jgi:hypothetical protein
MISNEPLWVKAAETYELFVPCNSAPGWTNLSTKAIHLGAFVEPI